jgi:cytochrome c oxidase subunit 2
VQAAPAQPVASLAEQGKNLFEVKGCASCHSGDSMSKRGPSLLKAFGQKVLLSDGTEVTRDENYLRESIEKPQAKLVKGYEPVMPTFQGLLSETEMNALIAYIKSLK